MLLITGCGRSGTEYISQIIQKLGLDVRHEQYGRDGIVDWAFVRGSRTAIQNIEEFETILHQVRHPLYTMRSAVTLSTQSWKYICEHSPCKEDDAPLIRAAKYWYYWNRRAQGIAQWTYRVEALSEVFEEFCRRINVQPDVAVLQQVPTNVNARVTLSAPAQRSEIKRLQQRAHKFTWQEVSQAVGPSLFKDIFDLAELYGYDLRKDVMGENYGI